jgi:hypothetical protein
LFQKIGLILISFQQTEHTLKVNKGKVWHKSSMEKGIVPRSLGIDTDAKWGFSHMKGWIFG